MVVQGQPHVQGVVDCTRAHNLIGIAVIAPVARRNKPFFVLPSYDCWQPPTLMMLTVIGRLPQAWATAALKTESWLYTGCSPMCTFGLGDGPPEGSVNVQRGDVALVESFVELGQRSLARRE